MKLRGPVNRAEAWGGDLVALDGLPPSTGGPQVPAGVVDGVDPHLLVQPGDDAVESAAGRGTAARRAAQLTAALAECRDEIPSFDGGFGELTESLATALDSASGGLRDVLEQHLELRQRIAAGIAGVSLG